MIKIKNGSFRNLPCRIGNMDAIAYDGCEFSLLLANQKAIVSLDQHLCPIATIPTCRKYRCLCYQELNHCYWAISDLRPGTLFMLDENFNEIDSIKISSSVAKLPCAISCPPCLDVIMILYADAIVYVETCKHRYQRIPILHCDVQNLAIQALVQGYVVAYHQAHQFFLEIHICEQESPCQFCIPEGYIFLGMYLDNFCKPSCNCIVYELHVLLCNECTHEQCLLPIQITHCEESCKDSCNGTSEGCDCCDNCNGCKDCDDNPSNSCGVNEILHSIALEEAALAHILNAEGEKIQKAVASSASIKELLQVNESVSRTISKVTILEGQLIAKLENVLCFCEEPEFPDCCEEDSCLYNDSKES